MKFQELLTLMIYSTTENRVTVRTLRVGLQAAPCRRWSASGPGRSQPSQLFENLVPIAGLWSAVRRWTPGCSSSCVFDAAVRNLIAEAHRCQCSVVQAVGAETLVTRFTTRPTPLACPRPAWRGAAIVACAIPSWGQLGAVGNGTAKVLPGPRRSTLSAADEHILGAERRCIIQPVAQTARLHEGLHGAWDHGLCRRISSFRSLTSRC